MLTLAEHVLGSLTKQNWPFLMFQLAVYPDGGFPLCRQKTKLPSLQIALCSFNGKNNTLHLDIP
jgi:hypothetical protein